MRSSIILMLQYNLFGVPFVGSDICGFNGATTRALCQRWSELGAFYPFSRNHNADGTPEQDPGVWPEVAEAARKALTVRYTLLPTLYTLFFKHVTEGSTVVRALFHEFPLDATARNIDRQFLWGSGILISPVLEEGVTQLEAYFPSGARWFDYYTGSEVPTGQQTLDAPLDHINVHVRGGGVYPTQAPALNTVLSRQNPFGLIIALSQDGTASGKLYVDDGDSIDPQNSGLYFLADYQVRNRLLLAIVEHNGYSGIQGQVLDNIRLLGAGTVTSVTVNGQPHSSFQQVGEEVKITELNLPVDSEFFIVFQ
jgi:alpha-glucosidase (family GH31 glycosyl hydrolase)